MAYSVVEYTGNGVTTTYAVTFPFLSRDHVTVRVNGTAQVTSWINDGLIQLLTPPPNGASVVISRDSSRAIPLVDFADAQVLTEVDLDTSTRQGLYVAQEAFDAMDGVTLPTQVHDDAATAAASATAAANSAVSAAADAQNAANSATAAAASAVDAAASALNLTSVWKLNQSNAVTSAQRANIEPNVTFDIDGAMAATFKLAPAASVTIPSDKTLATFHAQGNYVLSAGASVAPTSIDITTDSTSDITGSLYGYKARLAPFNGHAVYGYYADLDVGNAYVGGGGTASVWGLYLKVSSHNGADLPVPAGGALITMDVANPLFSGYGLEIKGSETVGGLAPAIAYGVVIRDTLHVSGAAFWYSADTPSADAFIYGVQGETNPRFTIDALGSTMFGQADNQRIGGDFSNAVHSKRLLLTDRSNARYGEVPDNKDVIVGAAPSGTGTKAGFAAYSASDADNASTVQFGANLLASTVGVNSTKTGTGTTRDFVFAFDGTEKARVKTDGTVQAPLQDKGGQAFNVKAFGAKGDGTTDDTTAIQAAINAAAAVGATRVVFPSGLYRTTATLTVTGPNGITLLADGAGIKLDDATGLLSAIVLGDNVTQSNNIVIDGLSFSRVQDATAGAAIKVQYCGNVTLRNIVVVNFGGKFNFGINISRGIWCWLNSVNILRAATAGIVLSGTGTGGNETNGVTLDDCKIEGAPTGMSILDWVEGLYCRSSVFTDCPTYGVNVNPSAGTGRISYKFADCDFDGCGGGLRIVGTTNIQVNDCWFSANTAATNLYVDSTCNSYVISGNQIYGTNTQKNLDVRGSNGVIAGNYITGGSDCIYTATAALVTISGNTIVNSAGYGVNNLTGPNGITITGNTFKLNTSGNISTGGTNVVNSGNNLL